MKKILSKLFIGVCLIVTVMSFCGCGFNRADVVRIHIRANSNSEIDQNVKICVRDAVVDYITPLIASANNSNEVKFVLNSNINSICNVANNVLSNNGFAYTSRAEIRNEYFPTRKYDDTVFPADYYDALIIELGSGKGDNWWCVAYPPLCFVGDDMSSNNVKYKSKLLELINKFWR